MKGFKRRYLRDCRSPRDGWAGKRDAIPASSRICRGDSARSNARVEPGALNAGQARKMAAWWHEIVGTQECAQVSRTVWGASTYVGGRERWRDSREDTSEIAAARGMVVLGKVMPPKLAATSSGLTARG